MRVKVFKDEEEVDATFFEALLVKCFRKASGVKYGGRFLIIRRDIVASNRQGGGRSGMRGIKKIVGRVRKIVDGRVIDAGM